MSLLFKSQLLIIVEKLLIKTTLLAEERVLGHW